MRNWALPLLGFLACAPSTSYGAQFQNGSFEVGNIPGPSGVNLSAGSVAISGWVVLPQNIDWIQNVGGPTSPQASDGGWFLDLNGCCTGTGGIQQTFDTKAGVNYTVTFDLNSNNDPTYGPPSPKSVQVTAAGSTQVFTYTPNGLVGPWNKHTFSFTATESQTTLIFHSLLPSSAVGPLLDNVKVTGDCEVNLNDVNVSLGGDPPSLSLDGKPTAIKATFVPGATSGLPSGLTAAANACGFTGFNWVQTIESLPDPSPYYRANGTPVTTDDTRLTSTSTPFSDPPFGGYPYQFLDPSWSLFQPHFATAAPFYYSPLDVPTGCAQDNGSSCITRIQPDSYTLNFFDAPKNPCLFGGGLNFKEQCDFGHAPFLASIQFRTRLVGICGSIPSPACTVPGKPSTPLYQWTWSSDFNGESLGGVFGVIAETASRAAPAPNSGTGGVTITSINGVPQTPPSVSCIATPVTLWPPNGRSVLVTTSGQIKTGTSSLVQNGGVGYRVIDEYGEVHPNGNITLGPGGSYSFEVPLISGRNRNDLDGRVYGIIVIAKDTLGNVGSCMARVTVPHDQRN